MSADDGFVPIDVRPERQITKYLRWRYDKRSNQNVLEQAFVTGDNKTEWEPIPVVYPDEEAAA